VSEVYEVRDGKLAFTQDFQRRRVRLKYPMLFPLFPPDCDGQAVLSSIKETLSGVDFHRGSLIVSPKDWMKPVFLYALLSLKEEHPFYLMNAYHLLDIFLGHAEEEYEAISEIEHRTVGIYWGYSEMENRRQSDMIEQFMSLSATRGPVRKIEEAGVFSTSGQATWLFYKGSMSALKAKFPRVVALAGELGFSVVDFGGGGVSVPTANEKTSSDYEEF
jgi:hypothetical protein